MRGRMAGYSTAVTGSTMKDVLERLVSEEFETHGSGGAPDGEIMRGLFRFAFLGWFITSFPRTSKAIVIPRQACAPRRNVHGDGKAMILC
jgi:hypothetical protein